MRFIRKLRSARQQRGLSFLEFIGCLFAMCGGVVLGSMYLGIDVRQMAVGVLEQAQVIAPGYFDQVAQTPAAGKTEMTKVETKELDAVTENTTPETSEGSAESGSPTVQIVPEPTAEERRVATRAYWDKLTASMLAEAKGRNQQVGSAAEWQLYDYLTQRMKGHEQALLELEGLDKFGVDERLAAHGEQVVTWHNAGVKLFRNAVSLLTDGPGAELSGPFAQSWQSAATQLQMEENLVVDRHKGVAAYLDREYAEEAPFVPAFQQ
jgi:hypothetical protein